MINPLAPFQYWNTRIHGITQFDVRNAPTFPDFWNNIRKHFSDVVVAHNAAFDISCLKNTIEHYGLEKPSFDYYCTLNICRKNLSLPSHKLNEVARYFQLSSFNHHNALDDAIICAKIFHRLYKNYDITQFKKSFGNEKTLSRYISKVVSIQKITIRNKRADIAKVVNTKGKSIKNADDFFDYSEIDFSKTFRVVGRFSDMSIGQIESIILRQGGKISNSVLEFPDYVVVGAKQNLSTPYGEFDDEVYIAKKSGISILSERHFLSQIF